MALSSLRAVSLDAGARRQGRALSASALRKGRSGGHRSARNDSSAHYNPSRAQAARSSMAPRTSAGSRRLSGRRAGARKGGRAAAPREGASMRICTLSPKRSRRTVRRSPKPSTRPSSRASAPTQNAPEKSSPFSVLSFATRGGSAQGRRRPRGCGPEGRFRRSTSFGFSGRKGSSMALFSPAVWTRRSTPIALDQAVEAETRRDDADRADDGGRVGEDLVARAGDHVAAGSRRVLDEDEDRQLLLLGERANAAEDQVRLRGRSAGRVDHHRDGLRARDREGPLEQSARRRQSTSPARNGITAPIAPLRRTAETTGYWVRNRRGRST